MNGDEDNVYGSTKKQTGKDLFDSPNILETNKRQNRYQLYI